MKVILSFLLLLSFIQAQQKPLRLGIFPYLSVLKITQHNKSLKEYLEKKLKRPIIIVSEKNIQDYLNGVKKGSYDLLFTAPHIGRYGQIKASYHPIAVTYQYIQGYFIVKKNSSIKDLSGLKNKVISMAPPIALIHQTAVKDLETQNIYLGKNIRYLEASSHTKAIINLLQKRCDVAITGVNIWKKLPKKHKSQLQVLKKSIKNPGFLLMGHTSLKKDLIHTIRKHLLKFHASKEGVNYLFKGYKKITPGTMAKLDQYIDTLK